MRHAIAHTRRGVRVLGGDVDSRMRLMPQGADDGPVERRHQIRRLLEVFDTDAMPVRLMGEIDERFVWGRPLRRLVARVQRVPAAASLPSRRPMVACDRIRIRPRPRLPQVCVHASPLAWLASDHLPRFARIGAGA